jgi:hypothetical protein
MPTGRRGHHRLVTALTGHSWRDAFQLGPAERRHLILVWGAKSATIRGRDREGHQRARRAWTFAANLVVLPGLGSLLMGRRSGWLRAPMALGGMTLAMRWLVLVLLDWRRASVLPDTLPAPACSWRAWRCC